METALQAICAAFQIEVKAGLESAVRQALSGRKALLILDGAEEADDLSALLKLRGACGVLITSRKKEDAPAELMQVRPLTEQQAEDVFRQYSGPVIDTISVQGICKLLGGWPVSLRIAGQYLSSTGENAADYLRWIEQEPFKELGSGQHQEENTALLLRRSVAQVSDDARLALSVAGCLAFAPLAREPVTTILDADERRARTALNKLVNYGLLEKQGERWQISHALIHTYARQELPLSRESLKQLAEYYIGFCETQSKIGLLGYARLDAERAHCLRLIESCLASKMWQEVKGLVGAISIYLDRQGHWTELLAALDMNLTAAQQTGDRKDEGWCLNSLGYICERREEREQALSWFEQSLSIARELGDRKQEGTLLNNIAMIYADQGKYELALEHYQQSLSIRQEVGDRVGEGATLNNIGLIYHAQGDYAQALQHYEHCLSISQEVGNKIGESKTLNNIAENYHAQANLAKAVEYHEQALAIRQELGDRAGEMESLWNIGRIYGNQGDFTKANEYMAIAVHIAETISHPYLEKLREGLSQVRDSRDRET